MRILVTGASGFIGGYVVRQFANNLSCSIMAIGRSYTSQFEKLKNVEYLQFNLADRFSDLYCDICIHCAGLVDDSATKKDFEVNNVKATRLLLRSLKNCGVFIYISSSSVYDFCDEKVKSESDARINSNISFYGISKLKAEELIRKSNIPSIYILRPRAVYGSGDRVLLPRILKLIGRRAIFAIGSFQVKTSLTHIHNLFEAIQKSLIKSERGIHVFNISDDYVYNLKDVFGEIAYFMYGHRNFIYIPIWFVKIIVLISSVFKLRPTVTDQSLKYLTQHSVLSIYNAKEKLNYKGSFNFFDSISQLDFRKRK
jgi:nucleoside-diphosphate-sugar epimerase